MIRAFGLFCVLFFALVVSILTLTPGVAPADFRYLNLSGIHTLDPVRMSWTQDLRLAGNLYEGLYETDPKTLTPTPAAALPADVSEDGRVYRFVLRPDARWSDGTPVTAGDFARAWRRAIEPGTSADYAFLLTDTVAGVSDYVGWRMRGVSVLTALARLADGWSIDAEQARRLLTGPMAADLRVDVESHGLAVPATADDPAWPDVARRLGSLSIPWRTWHDRLLASHAARMDSRFERTGIRVIDARTLTVRLSAPCPYFLDLVAFPTMVPVHPAIERLRERFRGQPLTREGLVVYDPQWTKPDYHANGYPGLVTNGAYRLESWTFKRSARLVVNPFYRQAGQIACRSIDMLVYDDANSAMLAYEAGDLDFIPGIEVPYAHEIARLARTGERPDFHPCQLSATFFFNFNCADPRVLSRDNPFIDARVRRAFCLAVDKRAIVEDVLRRGDTPAGAMVPPGAIPGYQSPMGLTYDPHTARRLLVDAGFPDGQGLPVVDILYSTSGAHEPICQAVARMWETELGVRVELRGKESKTFADDKARRRFMIARANWYADYNDPTTYLDLLATGNGNNDTGYSSAAYDRLLRQANGTLDVAARMDLLRRAERLIVEQDCPVLPLFHYTSTLAIKPNVHGLYPNARLVFPFRFVSTSP